MNRFASFLLLAVSLSVVSAFAETPVERYGQLAVDGNRLVSKKTGKPVQLRGMSFFWSMAGEGSSYYNAGAVNWLADDWKVNVVRAAMGINETWGQGYLTGGKDANRQRVVTVVDAAIAKGIYVIIDWHSHNAHTHTADAKAFFEEMASKYKDVPNVLYEIYNEPTGTNAAAWTGDIKPYAQTVVNAIRAIDPNNVIIIGTPTWCASPEMATASPVDGDNLVYTVHFYSAYAPHKEPLRTKVKTSLNTHNKAVFVSEFGVCMNTGKAPLDLDEATTWLNFLDENKVSWVNWSVTYKDEGASALKPSVKKFDGNWTVDDLTESGAYIRGKLIAAAQKEDNEWNTATLVTDLVIPNTQQTGGSAAIAPVSAQSNSFSVGPIPASKSKGGVKFFWQGKAVAGGSLFIYDALGNTVKNIRINEISANNPSKRTIGAWDLTDAKSRRVKTGSYLVKGKVIVQNGSVANVSSIIVVGN
jgi:endoglucanase